MRGGDRKTSSVETVMSLCRELPGTIFKRSRNLLEGACCFRFNMPVSLKRRHRFMKGWLLSLFLTGKPSFAL